jgi:LDH2 family malate/lactate/ureidoglycolate dehydrogenase
MIVSAAEEHELILAVLGAHGALPETATVRAHWLAEADLRGQGSHGMQRVPGTAAVRVPGDPKARPACEGILLNECEAGREFHGDGTE